MAENFFDILGNEGFGRAFRGSMEYRRLVRQYWTQISGQKGNPFEGQAEHLEIVLNDKGLPVFRSNKANYTFPRADGESVEDYFSRVISNRPGKTKIPIDPLAPVNDFIGLDDIRTSEVFRGGRFESRPGISEVIRRLNEEQGREVVARFMTLDIGDPSAKTGSPTIDRLYESLGMARRQGDLSIEEVAGIVNVNDDKIDVLEFIENGKRWAHGDILKEFGMDPSADLPSKFGKRLRAYTNKAMFSTTYDPGELRVLQLDTQGIFKNRTLMQTMFRNEASILRATDPAAFDAEHGSIEGFVSRKIGRESDGINFTHKAALERMIETERSKLQGILVSPFVTQAEKKEARQQLSQLADFKRKVDRNAPVGIRILSGEKVDGNVFGMGKGDVVTLEGDQFYEAALQDPRFVGMTREQILSHDFITYGSTNDLNRIEGGTSRVTFNITGKAGKSMQIDSLDAASHSGMLSAIDRDLIPRNLKRVIDEQLDAIESGDMSKLRAIARDIEDFTLNDFYGDESLFNEALERGRYIRQIEDFISTGGRIEESRQMTNLATRTVLEHFAQIRRDKMLDIGGRQIPDYALRVPLAMSQEAHIISQSLIPSMNPYYQTFKMVVKRDGASIAESIVANLPGAITPAGEDVARLKGTAGLMDYIYAFTGGSDKDDSFGIKYIYDHKTQRPLAFLRRVPTDTAEFGVVPLNIMKDAELASQRVVFRGRDVSVGRVEKGRFSTVLQLEELISSSGVSEFSQLSAKQKKRVRRLMASHNEFNAVLHEFMMGSGVENADIAKIFDPNDPAREIAPRSLKTTQEAMDRYTSGSVLQGYGQFRSVEDYFSSAVSESTAAARGVVSVPFERVSDSFSELVERSGGLLELPDLTPLPKTDALLAADQILKNKNMAIAKLRGGLGQALNVRTAFNSTVERAVKQGLISDAAKNAILARIDPISIVETEHIIDQFVQNPSAEELVRIQKRLKDMMVGMGEILREVPALKMDPVIWQQRGSSAEGHLLTGYQQGDVTIDAQQMLDNILMKSDDPNASLAKMYLDVDETVSSAKERTKEMSLSAEQNRMNRLSEYGFTSSVSERATAQGLIAEYLKDAQELMGDLSPEETLKLLQEGADSMIPTPRTSPEFSRAIGGQEELNARTIRRMQQAGLFESEVSLTRGLMALEEVALRSDMADETGRRVAGGILELTSRDKRQASVRALLNRINAAQTERLVKINLLKTIIDGQHRELTSTLLSGSGYDELPIANRLGFLGYLHESNIGDIREPLGKLAREMGEDASDLFRPGDNPTEILHRLNSINPSMGPMEMHMPDPPGATRKAVREVSEEAANTVTTGLQRRFGQGFGGALGEFNHLMGSSSFRKGLGVAGIFFGLGMVKILRGERPQEKMEGPLLLPGGSSYENTLSEPIMQGRYSGELPTPSTGGYTYRITANGNFNTDSFAQNLQGIVGTNVNQSIYSSRERNLNNNRNSLATLNSILGR